MRHKVLFITILIVTFVPKTWAYNDSIWLIGSGYIYFECDIGSQTAYVVAPNTTNMSWDGYYTPVGDIVIPDIIYHYEDWSGALPYNVVGISGGAFYLCEGMTSVTIPNSVTNIGPSSFEGCSSLSSITFGNNVTTIGASAFRGCSDLTSITIPASVTNLPSENPFEGCSNLMSIIVSTDNTVYDSRNNCNAIIETSSNTLITGCNNTIIPSSVTQIGGLAFCFCRSLTSIYIPESVTTIGRQAFKFCLGLTAIYIQSDIPPELVGGVFVFDGVNTNVSVCVPCGSIASYQSLSGWSRFNNYQEYFGYSLETTICENGHVEIINPTCQQPMATISAVPDEGYIFDHWSDGNTENPRTLTVTQDTSITAVFRANALYDGSAINIFSNNGQIVVEGAGGNSVALYDNAGNLIATSIAHASAPLYFDDLSDGTYFVKVGVLPARMKVVVIR